MKTLTRYIGDHHVHAAVLFIGCLLILIRTTAPTFYNFDSAELATGAVTLGIVHAPGYPLYLLIAHLVTYLPVGDVGYRINLLSVLCLAGCAPLMYGMIFELVRKRWISLTAALTFVWSYYVWVNGLVAEVYAPQLFTLAAGGWMLARLFRLVEADDRTAATRLALVLGLWFGVAVALVPSTVFFAPGLALAYRIKRSAWHTCLLAGALGVTFFLLCQLYFPIRYSGDPALNMAGHYGPDGTFQAVDLTTPAGLWWLISGEQFHSLFFAEGYLPSVNQVREFLGWFWGNFLGVGVVIGFFGAVMLYQHKRELFVCWLAFLLPYACFYLSYGAPDRDLMFGPVYLVWMVAFAYGLAHSISDRDRWAQLAVTIALPLLFFGVNFRLVDISDDTSVRDRAETMLAALPPNALVFGVWWDVVPLEHLQLVEDQRPDLQLYNLFLYSNEDLLPFLDAQVPGEEHPVIFLGDYVFGRLQSTAYRIVAHPDQDNSTLYYEVLSPSARSASPSLRKR
jgi:hypothetical protein